MTTVDVLEEVVRLRRAGRKCALATIIHANGSIPSYTSAKLLVRDDGSIVGTIGGGCVKGRSLGGRPPVHGDRQNPPLHFLARTGRRLR